MTNKEQIFYYLNMILKSGKIKNKVEYDKNIKYLYKMLENTTKKVRKTNHFSIKRNIYGKDKIKIPSGFNSYFFPEMIKDFIVENKKKQIVYNFNINNNAITVYFTLMCEDDIIETYDTYIENIIRWLEICSLYSNNCGEKLEIYIYLTEFKKELPKHDGFPIGPEHVNSGFSTSCLKENEIVLFRKEEWFKVFVHETFHAYGLDIQKSFVDKYQKKIKEVFQIKNNDVLIGETYAEVWARIINVLFFCYDKTETYKDFKKCFIFSLEVERLFSVIQANKVLSHYGLNYNDIIYSKKNKKYKEKTNTFCYYILSSLLLQEPYKFLEWCNKTNNKWLKFNNNDDTIIKFIEKIVNISKRKEVSHLFDVIKDDKMLPSLRMTLLDIDIYQ